MLIDFSLILFNGKTHSLLHASFPFLPLSLPPLLFPSFSSYPFSPSLLAFSIRPVPIFI